MIKTNEITAFNTYHSENKYSFRQTSTTKKFKYRNTLTRKKKRTREYSERTYETYVLTTDESIKD